MPPSPTAPFSVADFGVRLAALGAGPRLAIAFSGGGDSLALLILAAVWARKSKRRSLIAYTVDHGLRAEAAAEARDCARVAASLGVAHRILQWKGDKPSSGIQAAARAARYALLAEACVADDVSDLLVAHHLEDQAETFLLRLARGSGVDGLSGMAASRPLVDAPSVRLLRPLLDVPQSALRAVVARAGRTPVEDPSNANRRYDRVKARALVTGLADLGLTPQRLSDTAQHMMRVRDALDRQTAGLLQTCVVVHPSGYAEVDLGVLRDGPDEIVLRALAELLKTVSGQIYPPRFDALSAVHQALVRGAGLARARTLHGCRIAVRQNRLLVMREVAAAVAASPVTLASGRAAIWDGRFSVVASGKSRPGRGSVRALGVEGLRLARASGWVAPDAPNIMLPSLPALWAGDKLVAPAQFGAMSGKSLAPAPFSAVFLPRGLFGLA